MERDNKILSQKLNKISLKIPSPFQLNEEFIQIEAKNKMFIEKYKKLRENEIKEVNVQLKKRLKEKYIIILHLYNNIIFYLYPYTLGNHLFRLKN